MIQNESKDTVLSQKPFLAKSALSRMRGMLARKFDDFDAMIFEKNNSIHMFFMSYPLDVLYLDTEGKVIGIRHGIKPWRLSACSKAETTIELPEGVLIEAKTELGDQVRYKAFKII